MFVGFTILIMAARSGMAMPAATMSLMPVLAPVFMAVTIFLFHYMLGLAIIPMTVPSFVTPFINHVEFFIFMAAMNLNNVRVRALFSAKGFHQTICRAYLSQRGSRHNIKGK